MPNVSSGIAHKGNQTRHNSRGLTKRSLLMWTMAFRGTAKVADYSFPAADYSFPQWTAAFRQYLQLSGSRLWLSAVDYSFPAADYGFPAANYSFPAADYGFPQWTTASGLQLFSSRLQLSGSGQ
ncbi:hypothetical protein BDZ91DRAFT_763737 [Kalaharituber pfeilii]|nr:hypothetical protein BDZ91DRAFT_763737 [Kalaharituber pfeilii]